MSCSGVPRPRTSALSPVAPRPARVSFSACPEKETKERTPRGGAPARLRRSGVPAAGGVLGTAVKGHPVPSRLDRPSGPILPCARHQPPRHQGGGQNGASLRDIAASGKLHISAMSRSGEPSRSVPFEGGRLGGRAQGSRDRKSSEGDQARDGLFARAPSTASETGTCRGEAAAGHPAGTMALVPLAVTKGTRAVRRLPDESMPVSSAEPLSTPFSNGDRAILERLFDSSMRPGRGTSEYAASKAAPNRGQSRHGCTARRTRNPMRAGKLRSRTSNTPQIQGKVINQ
jgi:hypothetical protein